MGTGFESSESPDRVKNCAKKYIDMDSIYQQDSQSRVSRHDLTARTESDHVERDSTTLESGCKSRFMENFS